MAFCWPETNHAQRLEGLEQSHKHTNITASTLLISADADPNATGLAGYVYDSLFPPPGGVVGSGPGA